MERKKITFHAHGLGSILNERMEDTSWGHVPTLFYMRALICFSHQLKGVFIILDIKARKQR